MKGLHTWVGGLLVTAATFAVPAAAEAASKKPETAVAAARRQATEVKREYGKHLRAVNAKKDTLLKALRATPEWKEAVAERNKAAAELKLLSGPVLAAARQSNDFRALRTRRQKLRAELEKAEGSGPAGLVQYKVLADDANRVDAEVKQYEAEALRTDDNTAAAKSKLDEAQAKLDAMEAEVETKLSADTEYAAAKAQAESAKMTVASAETNLKTTIQADRQQRRTARIAAANSRRASRVRSAPS